MQGNGENLVVLLLSSPSKPCMRSPVPPFLLREFIENLLLPFREQHCNSSLAEEFLPGGQKPTTVLLSLKLEHYIVIKDNWENVCLVVGTLFTSKQPCAKTTTRVQNETFYRDVLLRLVSDICDVIHSGHVTLLSLLDVSRAFDTVDNDIIVCLRSLTVELLYDVWTAFIPFWTDRRWWWPSDRTAQLGHRFHLLFSRAWYLVRSCTSFKQPV